MTSGATTPRRGIAIAGAISNYTMRLRSIMKCANEHIPFALQTHQTLVESLVKRSTVTKEDGKDGEKTIKLVVESKEEMDELIFRSSAPHSEIISESLLIFGFSLELPTKS